ncbi:hypothetical protein P389DRAFT_178180 [Cystobasidium minutum MCA 4210]|uniref:uncharacterized protein n=1 Tax=Cystobasidium minutum MCA 4210 TaxID=1397322 RepID=UPI0034CFD40B|eukprot:jgi/Rhomi1/178180/fgenesh1_pg.2_\
MAQLLSLERAAGRLSSASIAQSRQRLFPQEATRDRQFLQDDNKQAIALLVLLASTTGLRSSSLSQELTAPKIEELIPSSLTISAAADQYGRISYVYVMDLEITALPVEVVVRIATYLDTEDLMTCLQVCKTLSNIFRTNAEIWRSPTLLAFPGPWGASERPGATLYPSPSSLQQLLNGHTASSLRIQRASHVGERTLAFFNPEHDEAKLLEFFKAVCPLSSSALDTVQLSGFGGPDTIFLLKLMKSLHHIKRMLITTSIGTCSVYDKVQHILHLSRELKAATLELREENVPLDEARLAEDVVQKAMACTEVTGVAAFHYLLPPLPPSWDLPDHGVGIPIHVQHCHLVGGFWALPGWPSHHLSSPSPLEVLIIEGLQDLSSQTQPGGLALPKLHTLKITFNSSVVYDDIAYDIAEFLDFVEMPSLRRLMLSLPHSTLKVPLGRDYFDRVFDDFVGACGWLEDVTLEHLIPATIASLFDNCGYSLIRLVLRGDCLPQDFPETCTPEFLPNIKTLDLSGTNFHRLHTLRVQQAFVDVWRNVRELNFSPPSAFRDTVYRGQVTASA